MKRKAIFVICIIFLISIFASSIIVPTLSKYNYDTQLRGEERQLPSKKHLLGTDGLGRDLLIRILYATKISLIIGIICSLANVLIGTLYGATSAIIGGKVDLIMMRIIDILLSIPKIVYVVFLSMLFNGILSEKYPEISSVISTILAIGCIYWLNTARIVRAEMLTLKEKEFVKIAVLCNSSKLRIIFRHLLPNCIPTILTITILQIPNAIFAESFLSFIGIGISAPIPSWGSLIYEGIGTMYSFPQTLICTSIIIISSMFAINYIGEEVKYKFEKNR